MKNMNSLKYILLILPALLNARDLTFKGSVYGLEYHHHHTDSIPLFGANIYWQGTNIGTISHKDGQFYLNKPNPGPQRLIISYAGYEKDTVDIRPDQKEIKIVLERIHATEGVSVEADRAHFSHNDHKAIETQTISRAGLRTLACCNLSESFESTASVDVETQDAVSGAKRIKMLGLAGFYTQLLIEKKPVIRGLITPFGMDYIPGAWMESIDISKGTASVMTGYESTTGQINVEFQKPEMNNPPHLNLYQNSMGKTEGNIILSRPIAGKVSTMMLAYGHHNRIKLDQNSDTFLDMPLTSHLNIMNRWKYNGDRTKAQWGVKYIHDHRDSGQKQYDFKGSHTPLNTIYGFHNRTKRLEIYAKGGTAFNASGNNTLGFIFSAFSHDQNGFMGIKSYDGEEKSLYGNLIYQHTFNRHTIAAGVSYLYDDIMEKYNGSVYPKTEKVPGLFTEYTYKIDDKLTGMAGIRYDDHNLYGDFLSPRFHLKYHITPLTIIRTSVGKGYRSPNLFAENPGILVSSKSFVLLEDIKAEEAWNYGIHLVRDFELGHDLPATFSVDFYRTEFENQLIIDLEQDIQTIYVYNLQGESYSNSLQVELNASLPYGLETTAAWRMNDVRATYEGELRQVPMSARHKGLLVLSYSTPEKKWQMDLTTQLNGKARLPKLSLYPESYQRRAWSPVYTMMFAQLKRKFQNMEFYMGVENLTNYTQQDPIIAWQNPFSPYFDSSLIWGPTIGRRFYVGWRLN